jgi:hypothetical protein
MTCKLPIFMDTSASTLNVKAKRYETNSNNEQILLKQNM